jgi:hypothetical protein
MMKSTAQEPIPPSTTGTDLESPGAVVCEKMQSGSARANKSNDSDRVLKLFGFMLALDYASAGEKSLAQKSGRWISFAQAGPGLSSLGRELQPPLPRALWVAKISPALEGSGCFRRPRCGGKPCWLVIHGEN